MTNRRRARIASTMWWSSGLVVIVAARVAIGRADFLQQLLDAILSGDRFVVPERQLGDAPEPEPRPNLPAQKRSGPLDGARGALAGLVVAEHGVEHARLLKVRRHLHARDRHEPDARIVYVAGEQAGELGANLIGHAVGPRPLRQEKISSSCLRCFRGYAVTATR